MKKIKEGEYMIPKGCVAKVKNGIVTVRESKRRIPAEVHCRDCRHFGFGATTVNAWYDSPVCFLKRKEVKDPRFSDQKIYSYTADTQLTCEKFERKE